jgi:hypothetical protein
MPDFMNIHMPGLGNASSYQVSAKPFLSSSVPVPVSGATTLSVSFPQVTSFVTIRNLTAGSQMRLGFSDAGVKGSNYYLILGGEQLTTEVKCSKIVLMSNNATSLSASLLAGLTNIPATELPNNWSGSAGVG